MNLQTQVPSVVLTPQRSFVVSGLLCNAMLHRVFFFMATKHFILDDQFIASLEP